MSELLSLFFVSFLSATLLPGGSEAYLLYLLYEQQHTVSLIITFATIGNTLGGFSNYLIGYWVESRFVRRYVNNITSKKKQKWYQYAKHLVQKWGYWALLFAWTPVVGDLLCLVAGFYRLNWIIAIILIGLGKLFRYILVVLLSFHLS
ncbi:MAG: DedA family protein [Gammaproteobacteria bacterium]|nr:DedA family protein [Gammaproteobacteria bacterium]